MKHRLILLLVVLLSTISVKATNYYWVGTTGFVQSWGNANCWSLTSGGAGGAGVPGASDIAYFTNGSSKTCIVLASVSVGGLNMTNYTSTITLGTSVVLTIGSSGLSISSGILSAGSGSVVVNGSYTQSGGEMACPSSLSFDIYGGFSYSGGTFTHNSGTVNFKSKSGFTSSTYTGNTTFYNLTFETTSGYSKQGTISSGNTLTVNNDLTLTGPNGIRLLTGTINVKGNITTSHGSYSSAGTALITVTGTGSQSITGSSLTNGALPKVTINKSSGTLTLYGYISVDNSWTYTSGTIDADTSTVAFGVSGTITGSHTLNNAVFQGKSAVSPAFTVATGTILTLNGSLSFENAAKTINMTGGEIRVAGDVSISTGAGTSQIVGTTIVRLNGTDMQTLSGTSSKLAWLPIIYIDNTDTVELSGGFCIPNQWHYIRGTIIPGSSTVGFVKNAMITGNDHSLNNVEFYSTSSGTSTFLIKDTTLLTVNGLKLDHFNGTNSISFSEGTINIEGNITNSNTAHPASHTATFQLTGTGSQTINGNGALHGSLPGTVINKPSGTLYLNGVISMLGNWTYTAGTVDVSTYSSTLYFDTKVATTISGTHTLDNLTIYRTGASTSSLTISSGSTVTLEGDFTTENTGLTTLNTGDLKVKGNITLTDMLDGGTGRIHLTGSNNQRVQGTTSNSTGEIPNLTINKSSGNITLAKYVNIKNNVDFLKGVVTSYNNDSLLVLLDNCTATNFSDTSFVSGPVKKIGNDAFTFPIGKSTYHVPTGISAPSSTTDAFTAEYFNTEQTQGSSKASYLMTISTCEHWKIDKNSGTSNVNVTLSWGAQSCNIPYYLTDLRLTNWSGTQWIGEGNSSQTGDRTQGTFTANGVNTYGYFTYAEVQTVPREIVVHNVDPVTLYKPEIGTIDIEVVGGYLPLSYSWSNSQTTEDLDSLSFGSYTLTVTDNNSNQIQKTIEVNVSPTFSDLTNASFANKVLTATHSTDAWDLSGATSDDYIEKGHAGSAYAVIPDASKTLCFALSDIDYGQNYDHVKYGLLLDNHHLFVAMDSSGVGLTLARDVSNDTIVVSDGDTIMIERVLMTGDSVSYRFYYNSYEFYRQDNVDKNRALMVDVAFKTPNASIQRLIGKFEIGKLTYRPCTSDNNKNYATSITYDQNGTVIAKSRVYYDLLGRPLQSQALDIENQNALASQVIYDEFGRATIQTLPAPLYRYNVDCYANYFVRNDDGTNFSYTDFDLPNTTSNNAGETYNPNGVNNVLQGSLGWYYSNNNTSEAYVAASSYPYSRVEFHSDPLGRVRSKSAPGEKLKTGTGNEGGLFYLHYGNELTYVNPDIDGKSYLKTIAIDAEKNEAITWKDNWGNTVATARSGLNGSSLCNDQWAETVIEYNGTRSATIHVPDAGKSDVYFEVSPLAVLSGTKCDGQSLTTNATSNWGIKITDLRENRVLVENTDYSFSSVGTYRYRIVFAGDYASGSDYFRISVNYTDDYLCVFYSLYAFPGTPPDVKLINKLDYTHFTLYKYDNKGLLTDVYSPAAIDCQNYDPSFQLKYAERHNYMPIYNYSGSSYNTASNIIPDGDNLKVFKDHTTNSDYTSNPSKYDRKVYINLSNFGSIIQVDPADLATACDPTNASTDFLYSNLQEKSSDHGSGTVENLLAKDNVYNTVTKEPTMVTNPSVYDIIQRRWLNGYREMVPSGEDDPDGCNNTAHCYDGITNCSETSTDVGGGCPAVACAGVPPELLATYVYTFQFKGWDGHSETILDEYGNTDAGKTFTFTAYLYKTCTCEYFFDGSAMSSFFFNIPEAKLATYSELRFYLASIDVKVEPSPAFASLNASDKIHDFAKYVGFTTDYTLVLIPQVSAPSHNVSGGYADQYYYNEKFQMDRAVLGDEGTKQVVYDTYGRVRFSRNSVQAANNQFSYVQYDRKGRVIETGVYTSNSGIGNIYEFHEDASETPTSGYTSVHSIIDDNTLPSSGGFETTTYAYDFPDASPGWASGSLSGYVQHNMQGRPSVVSNDNSTIWYSYNMYGEIEWTIQYVNDLSKYFSMQYDRDYLGHITQTSFQDEASGEEFYQYYTYDNNQRLSDVKSNTTDNSGTAAQDAAYDYYLHGPSKRVELGNQIQGLDYVYTINGWLKSINAPELSDRDPGKDSYTGSHSGFAKDVFGMTLDYFTGDYLRKNTDIQTFDMAIVGGYDPGQHNGNIKAIRWQTQGSTISFNSQELMYYYQYDAFNQLTTSDFYTISASGTGNGSVLQYGQTYYGPTASAQTAYSEKSITYDLNGNIQSLQRKDETGTLIDNLSYTYLSNSNQLDYVDDAVSSGTVSYDIDDQASGNYVYNDNGQITNDVQKDIEVLYYQNGLVKEVKQNASPFNTLYTLKYDQNGQRLKKVTYSGGSVTQTTYYIRDAAGSLLAVYDDNGTLTQSEAYIHGAGQVGTYDRGSTTRKYQITDHLGNVRAVVLDTKDGSGNAQLAESTDYFPFGAQLPGRNFISSGGYRFSYQGQETIEVNGQSLVTFELRNYDPNIGRWMSPDPYSQFFSPYLANANNPALFADPTGGYSDPTANHTFDGAGIDDEINPLDEYYWDKPTKWRPSHYYLLEIFGMTGLMSLVADQLITNGYSYNGYNWEKKEAEVNYDRLVSETDANGNSGYVAYLKNADGTFTRGTRIIYKTTEVWDYPRFLYSLTRPIPQYFMLSPEMTEPKGGHVFSSLWALEGKALDYVSGGDNYLSKVAGIASLSYKLAHGRINSLGAAKSASGIVEQSASASNSNLWRVGPYKDLQGLEKGLQAHHVGQSHLMKKFVQQYETRTAPSILVPEAGHLKNINGVGRVAATRGAGNFSNARQVLARDIFELRRVYGAQGIPNEALERLIELNKQLYPEAFIK